MEQNRYCARKTIGIISNSWDPILLPDKRFEAFQSYGRDAVGFFGDSPAAVMAMARGASMCCGWELDGDGRLQLAVFNESRRELDGIAYTHKEFMGWYGTKIGSTRWDEAPCDNTWRIELARALTNSRQT